MVSGERGGGVNASDLFSRCIISSRPFSFSLRSRPIFGVAWAWGITHTCRDAGKFAGKKYRSIVTVPSETVSEPLFFFLFFFPFGSVTRLQSAGQKWEIAKIYKALRGRIGEKNARAFDVLIVIVEATFRFFEAGSIFSWEEREKV